MDDAWGHVLTHASQKDLIAVERVSRNMQRLGRREWYARKEVDIQRDFPNATTDSEHMISIIDRLSPAVSSLRIGAPSSSSTDSPTYQDEFPSSRTVTRSVIEAISKKCTRLKKLAIHRMTLTLNAIVAFPLLPCTIEELTITICRMDCYTEEEGKLAQEAMSTLVSSLPRLRRFEILGRGACYDHFVLDERVLLQLPHTVTHINLSAGHSLKLVDLRFLKQRQLNSFTLQRSFISSKDLEGLVLISPNIRHLDLSYSRNISDFSAISKLQFLKTLNLSGNRDLLDDHLTAICRACPALVEVDLEHCAKLTSNGLVSLGLLHSLQRLCLSGLPSVNLAVIEALTRCIDLARLDVSFCRSVDVSCISSLLSDFPLLRLVVMKGNKVDRKMVDHLRGESYLPFLECDTFKGSSPVFSRPPPLPLL
ncbi:hypothetical protein PMAYCL1PPCAC_19031 [Pristionchus mayeri]|uniref:Uncharacterized protein n=1 Tax=Pristionchus mayeri TaxID=1317129 RepID=A0AAN5CQL0_9BILA|nr:hypothetical protein PMAYCL1PPCAC_19031 [Pristionchus mayeri]